MSQPVLVITEAKLGSPGKFNPASWEAVAAAQQLGQALGAPVIALVLEAVLEAGLEASESDRAADLARRQLDRVCVARHPALAHYDPEVWTQTLHQVVTRLRPSFVLLPHTYQARDYAPQLATRMGSGLITDVTGFSGTGADLRFLRPMFQGKWSAATGFTTDATGFVTVQIGAFRGDLAALGASPAPVEMIEVSPGAPRIAAGPVFQEAKQAIDLSQADIIVSVGRGIKEPKNLELVRGLADALGGELAASRPICDSGWLPMDRQIGSSGQTVAPKLYLAVGISGAIQHLVGMKGSRAVVAINKDPEAPIFEVADYGIVGNLFEVVPALIEEIRKLRDAAS